MNDGVDGCGRGFKYLFSVVNEGLHSFIGVAEDSFVLFVKDFGDDFEHLELVGGYLVGLSYKCTKLILKLPHEHENVLFEVNLDVGIDVG